MKRHNLINQPNKDSFAPIHLATTNGSTQVIDILLSHGADINIKTSSGDTSLHLAAALCNNADIVFYIPHELSEVRNIIVTCLSFSKKYTL